jgi:hypothetical protein
MQKLSRVNDAVHVSASKLLLVDVYKRFREAKIRTRTRSRTSLLRETRIQQLMEHLYTKMMEMLVLSTK